MAVLEDSSAGGMPEVWTVAPAIRGPAVGRDGRMPVGQSELAVAELNTSDIGRKLDCPSGQQAPKLGRHPLSFAQAPWSIPLLEVSLRCIYWKILDVTYHRPRALQHCIPGQRVPPLLIPHLPSVLAGGPESRHWFPAGKAILHCPSGYCGSAALVTAGWPLVIELTGTGFSSSSEIVAAETEIVVR